MFIDTGRDEYGIKQRATNLFITFFFAFFLFQVIRKIARTSYSAPINNQNIMIETILFMLWYSLTLILT